MNCRYLLRGAALFGALLSLGLLAPQPVSAKARLSATVEGKGAPLVVFEAGHGDTQAVWRPIARIIARSTRTFRYDRPGYGGSADSPEPRDPCSAARRLHAELAARDLKPPYVLVGHSLGGLYQYVFAKLYPGEVAALVLVDGTHPDHWRTMHAEAPDTARAVEAVLPTFTAAMQRELREMGQCTAGFLDEPLDIPVRLLFRTRYDRDERGAFQQMTERLQKDWQRVSTDVAADRVERAGHYIQRDRSDVVIAAIRQFVAR